MKIFKTANYKELFDKLSDKEKQEHTRNFEEGLKKELKSGIDWWVQDAIKSSERIRELNR